MTTKAIRTVTQAYLDSHKQFLHAIWEMRTYDAKNYPMKDHLRRNRIVKMMAWAIMRIKVMNLRNLKLKRILGIRK